MLYPNVSFNIGIGDDEFEFSPPIGVKIIEPETKRPNQVSMEDAENNVNFTILNPSYTAGYEFSGATVSNFGAESISLIYTKGGKTMTITQTTSQENRPLPDAESVGVREAEGELTDIFGNKLLRFGYDGINVMIAGTISKEELIKVAESMVAQKATTA